MIMATEGEDYRALNPDAGLPFFTFTKFYLGKMSRKGKHLLSITRSLAEKLFIFRKHNAVHVQDDFTQSLRRSLISFSC
jgi:hypothetical protein